MSFAQRLWSSTESTLKPMILVFRLSNSDLMRAMYPSSVVHTGVKSLGWEKRITHWLPIHWWKSIGPWVVCAVKFGASSPIRNAIGVSFRYARAPNRNALAAFAPAVIRARDLGSTAPTPEAASAQAKATAGVDDERVYTRLCLLLDRQERPVRLRRCRALQTLLRPPEIVMHGREEPVRGNFVHEHCHCLAATLEAE